MKGEVKSSKIICQWVIEKLDDIQDEYDTNVPEWSTLPQRQPTTSPQRVPMTSHYTSNKSFS